MSTVPKPSHDLRRSGRLALALALAALPLTDTLAASPAEEGQAAFYADRFEGKRTASGEPYQSEAMTCAHRSHPFGALLAVTDLATGRTVRVRVNDRGPFRRGFIVDLSKAAARQLGILRRGVARVRVIRVE